MPERSADSVAHSHAQTAAGFDQPTKLQKLMAAAGYGARRKCEQMIREGRVTVNGQPAKLGDRAVLDRDQIAVDGELIRSVEPLTYIALHKPPGVLSSARSQGGWPTVLDLIPAEVKLQPVGRLDLDSEGLMLLTNDGHLTHRLTHPRFGHEKEYRVLLDRLPDQDQLRRWREGLVLPGGQPSGPAVVEIETGGHETWLRIILRQGKKRQLRESARVLGLKVERLIRIRIASLKLGDLAPGNWRNLEKSEIIELQSASEGT